MIMASANRMTMQGGALATATPGSVGELPRGRPGRDGYSRFVGLMKWLLPALALSMIALIALWPNIDFESAGVRSGFLSSLRLVDIENLTLIRARYVGTDENNRPYTVTADMASQENPESPTVSLAAPAADITLEDGKWVAVTARAGEFNQQDQTLALNGEVSVFHDDGYSFRTEGVRINLADGSAEGDLPVSGHGPAGTLEAEGFRIVDKGRQVFFTGRTSLIILPGANRSLMPGLQGQEQ